MPNIMLKKSSISAISRQIEKMQTESEDAEKKIRSALNGLDFEVASKQNIRNCLNNLITSANRQGNLSGQYKSAFLNVTNSVVESDSKYGNRSQSIFEKIKTFVEDTTKKFKDLIINNRLAKISAVAGLFIISPITVITIADIKLLERIASIVKRWFTPSPKKDDSNGKGYPTQDEKQTNQEEEKRRREEEERKKEEEKKQQEEKLRQERLEKADGLETVMQESSGPCVMCAITNLMRRKQVIDGGEATIDYEKVIEYNAANPNEAKYYAHWDNFSKNSPYSMRYDKGVTTTDNLNSLLDSHPEGIVVYAKTGKTYIDKNGNKQPSYHAITVTSYKIKDDGTFQYYVMDSAKPSPNRVCALEDSYMGRCKGTMENILSGCNRLFYMN